MLGCVGPLVDSAMTEILFSVKGVALYGTTLVNNVRSPMSMLRKHCHQNCKDDEGKWLLLTDIPLNQKIDSGEHIVTILSKNRIVANAL